MAIKNALHETLQDAATSGNGTAVRTLTNGNGPNREHSFYIIGSAGVASGAVQIETANDPTYAGTWAPLGSPITVTASTVKIFQVTGALIAVRARISTAVTGGTVTVDYAGN